MNNDKNQNSKSRAILLQRSQMSQYFQCPYRGIYHGRGPTQLTYIFSGGDANEEDRLLTVIHTGDAHCEKDT